MKSKVMKKLKKKLDTKRKKTNLLMEMGEDFSDMMKKLKKYKSFKKIKK